MESKSSVEILRQRILQLLDAEPHRASREVCDFLGKYWQMKGVEFGTKMEPWKAGRIDAVEWKPPILHFQIERHPGHWERDQHWVYDFNTDEATFASERSPPHNPRYTKKEVQDDAQGIVDALLKDSSSQSIERKHGYYRVWIGRLPHTKPVPYDLPQRTARDRQVRLKREVAKLMEIEAGFERMPEQETTGSLVYKRKVSS